MKSIEALYVELRSKVAAQDEASGTVALIDAGVHEIGKKLVEEAAETWMAAEHESDEAFAEEASQLLYHVVAMLIAKDMTLDDLYRYL